MFINNWYVACIADELADTPKRVRILGADLVMFRDESGVAHCLSDLCVHRGASLAVGQCKGGKLECPQHGWVFNGAGRCTLIPAGTRTPTEPPKRARVPAYPVQEQYGLVFVFLGDQGTDERPALPDIMPEWDSDDWHKDVISRHKDINYLRMAENYNDPCHVHYIHEFAKWLPKGVTIVDHELTDRYVKAWHAAWDAEGNYGDSAGLMMEYNVISCVSRNTNYQPDYPPQIVTAYVTPIDERNTQIHMVILMPKHESEARDGSRVRGATAEEHRMLVAMTRDTVMDEDYVVLKTTRPRQAASPTEELLVDADRTLAQVRKMTVEYGEQAGRIDTAAWREVADTHIRVIPCPGHREDPKNWVHKTVSLLSGTGRGALKAAS
ncbi:MAG: aromatic ring-hydroxylating dioxygenase subunit alpha [Chromatiales bacterium]|nr:MAG: aromatic ring-hydroxylating dioxygenase subunit alpha [Chromatiales bacterium]